MKTENDRLYFRLLSGVVRHSSESEINDALLQIGKAIKQRRIIRNLRIKVAVSTAAATFLLAFAGFSVNTRSWYLTRVVPEQSRLPGSAQNMVICS